MEQQTPEWFEAKKGKMSSSSATAIGNCGTGLETYAMDLVASMYSSNRDKGFSSKYMDNGNEYEEVARSVYELETGEEVQQVGLVEYSDFVVCSPDGLVGDKGLIEIKCPKDTVYFKQYLIKKEIPSGYIWQMQMQMLTTGREWCDFMAYNPNYKRSYFIQRVYPDPKKVEKLLEGFRLGEEMIKNIINTYNE